MNANVLAHIQAIRDLRLDPVVARMVAVSTALYLARYENEVVEEAAFIAAVLDSQRTDEEILAMSDEELLEELLLNPEAAELNPAEAEYFRGLRVLDHFDHTHSDYYHDNDNEPL